MVRSCGTCIGSSLAVLEFHAVFDFVTFGATLSPSSAAAGTWQHLALDWRGPVRPSMTLQHLALTWQCGGMDLAALGSTGVDQFDLAWPGSIRH